MTQVIFRKYPNGDIIALFPTILDGGGNIQSYMHIGQHGAATYSLVIRQTVKATKQESSELRAELKQMGYNVRVRE